MVRLHERNAKSVAVPLIRLAFGQTPSPRGRLLRVAKGRPYKNREAFQSIPYF